MKLSKGHEVYRVLGGARREDYYSPPEQRLCSRFFCNVAGEQRCCADCIRKHRGQCIDPCLNDPSRCGLELERATENTDTER